MTAKKPKGKKTPPPPESPPTEPKPEPAEGGRPRVYDRKATLERFRVEMAKGTRGMDAICADDGMPSSESIYLWIAEDTPEGRELFTIFTRAQELWCWAQKEIIIQICDDESRDIIENEIETFSGRIIKERRSDNTAVNRDKLRVTTRQWAMNKLLAKHFGDKIQAEHTGADGTPLIPVLNITIEK